MHKEPKLLRWTEGTLQFCSSEVPSGRPNHLLVANFLAQRGQGNMVE